MLAELSAAPCEMQAGLPGKVLHPSEPNSGCSDNSSGPQTSAATFKRSALHVLLLMLVGCTSFHVQTQHG